MPNVAAPDARRALPVTLKAVVLLSSVLTIVFLLSFFFSDRGMADLQLARGRVEKLHSDIRRLEAEKARLQAEIRSVRNSTYTVERVAREDLGMSRKGEVVYLLPRQTP